MVNAAIKSITSPKGLNFKLNKYLWFQNETYSWMEMGGLSEKDLVLIKNLEGSCKVNYKQVADKLGISHTAVKKRLTRIVSRGYASLSVSLNLRKLGFILALLFLEVATDEYLSKLLDKFNECPRIISMFKVMGEYNLVALIYAEDPGVLDSILGSCMLRTMKGIRKSKVIPISNILINQCYNVRIPVREREIAPCGADCYNCKRYKAGECMGCPAVKYYTGWFSVKP